MITLHLRSTQCLASLCWQQRIFAFKMRPKHHYLWHVGVMVGETRLNPSLFHVWEDEKFLGHVKLIARQCHGATMQKRALERYVLALSECIYAQGSS